MFSYTVLWFFLFTLSELNITEHNVQSVALAAPTAPFSVTYSKSLPTLTPEMEKDIQLLGLDVREMLALIASTIQENNRKIFDNIFNEEVTATVDLSQTFEILRKVNAEIKDLDFKPQSGAPKSPDREEHETVVPLYLALSFWSLDRYHRAALVIREMAFHVGATDVWGWVGKDMLVPILAESDAASTSVVKGSLYTDDYWVIQANSHDISYLYANTWFVLPYHFMMLSMRKTGNDLYPPAMKPRPTQQSNHRTSDKNTQTVQNAQPGVDRGIRPNVFTAHYPNDIVTYAQAASILRSTQPPREEKRAGKKNMTMRDRILRYLWRSWRKNHGAQ